MTGRRISTTRKLIYGSLLTATLLMGLEAAVRVVLTLRSSAKSGTAETNDWLDRLVVDLDAPESGPSLYEPDPSLFWRLRPATQLELVNGVYETHGEPVRWKVTINAEGHRGPPYPDRTTDGDGDGPVVLLLGDSCTFGFRVDDGDTYPRQLESYLASAGLPDARVINRGVPGYTSFQGRRLLDELLQHHSPDVVILAFGANDHELDQESDADKAASIDVFELELGYALNRLATVRLVRSLTESATRASPESPGSDASGKVQRVSVAEFRDNLMAMVATAKGSGARVMLLDLVLVGPIFRNTIAGVAHDSKISWIDGRVVLDDGLQRLRDGDFASERARLDHFWSTEVRQFREVYFDEAYYAALFADPDRRDLLRYFLIEPVHANALGNRLLAEAIGRRLEEERDR